ncbi:ENTH-domain-containing protein [Trametes cingulata]|nr:ENTH-domain-containing protein [Trametes cingulata]
MSGMQHLGKGIVRAAKNYTKGYSDVQAKVRDATSNDPWGPSGTQMNELAQLSYNQDSFVEIMEMLDKRLNDKGKNWRHVFKSLTVLDYLLHAGSENVVVYFRDNLYVIKTLKEFQYIDEEGKDQGANVRQKAKDITNLLQDESRLRHERRDRAMMRDRMTRGRGDGGDEDDSENAQRRSQSLPSRRRNGNNREDEDLRKALEESKRTAAEELARQRLTAEERDLQQAIKLSEEEEARRAKAVQDANQSSLFDDAQQQAQQQNNPFPLVDTSFQSQSQFLQPQFTQIQPQFTSFNPYQQQAQQEAMQAEYMRQQQEWQMQQQQLQLQQQQQAQQEEWMRQQQLLQLQQQQQQQQQFLMPQQPLMPQATGFGSNNPFAPTMSLSTSSLPSSTGPQTASPVSFNLQGTYGQQPQTSQSPPPPSQSAPPGRQGSMPAVKTRADEEHAKLASLFANREDGIDTFGNFGALRYGQQAGKFVGQQQTGHNPFARQQQQQQQGSDQPFFSI